MSSRTSKSEGAMRPVPNKNDVVDSPVSMDQVQRDIDIWARKTFKQTTQGIAAHMLSEAVEAYKLAGGDGIAALRILLASWEKPAEPGIDNLAEEVADVAILAMVLAGHKGFSLHGMVEGKMYRNRLRKWGTPNAHGYTEHTDEYPPEHTYKGE